MLTLKGPQEKEIIDQHQLNQEFQYEDDDEALLEYCRKKRRESTLACLQALQEHLTQYLDENLNSWWRAKNHYHDHISLRKLDDDGFEIIFHRQVPIKHTNICSYEDWIRLCHPENTECDREELSFTLDDRFYHKDSHHRQLWNSYVDSYECPELKVNER